MLRAGVRKVEPRRLQGRVAQQVRQLGDVPAGLVEHPGEEVPEIVREDLGGLHARVPAQGLQLRPDLAPASCLPLPVRNIAPEAVFCLAA